MRLWEMLAEIEMDAVLLFVRVDGGVIDAVDVGVGDGVPVGVRGGVIVGDCVIDVEFLVSLIRAEKLDDTDFVRTYGTGW